MGNDQTNKTPKLNNELILIAEDDPSNSLYIEKLLQRAGASTILARTGNEVLEILAKHTNVSMILMDIKMPDMNGIVAFQTLRKNGVTIPVIAQTAYALADELNRLKEVGFNDYISKPIKPNDLYALIVKLLNISY